MKVNLCELIRYAESLPHTIKLASLYWEYNLISVVHIFPEFPDPDDEMILISDKIKYALNAMQKQESICDKVRRKR